MTHRVVNEYTKVDSTSSNIKVFVRARPLDDPTIDSDFIVVDPDNQRMSIKDPDPANRKYGEVSFHFDRIFWKDAKQEEVFMAACRAQVDHVLNGYNSCCFAYGQTGSGKTYTMFGEDSEIRGVIPRSVEYLFSNIMKKINEFEIATVCSFLEIYNDTIRDLGKAYLVAMGVEASSSSALFEKTSDIFESLAGKRGNPYFAPAFHKNWKDASASSRPGLKEVQDEYNTMNNEIREDTEGNVFVQDLSMVPVNTIEQAMSMISMGLRVRATHETKMNASSSRSHTIFTVTVLQKNRLTGEAVTGRLNLVDLAGSERLKKSESQGVRLKEALHINSSLTALGKVVMSLDPSSEMTHIPYRDSKLTRVLQNSLGGNSYTAVIAAIHPHPAYFEECLSTLQFANRCRNVRNNPRVNYVGDTEDKDRRIRRLLDEIAHLRARLAQLEGSTVVNSSMNAQPAAIKWSPAKLVSLLNKMGVTAMIGADGGVLVNGRSIKMDDLGLNQGSSEVVDYSEVPGASEAAMHLRFSKLKQEERMKAQLVELQEEKDKLTVKNRTNKSLIEEQTLKIKELSDQVLRLQTDLTHKDIEFNELVEDKDRELQAHMLMMNAQETDAIRSLINNNRNIVAEQNAVLTNSSAVFQEYTSLLNKKKQEKNAFEEPLRRQFEKHLKKLEASRKHEREGLQKQYERWIFERDKSLEEFVQKFNTFRAKKAEQLRMCEKEIVQLYEYTEVLDTILTEVESGSYRIRQAQGTSGKRTTGMVPGVPGSNQAAIDGYAQYGQVVLPRGLRPPNPFKGKTFELTKRLVERHRLRIEQANTAREEAFYKTLNQAKSEDDKASAGSVDTSMAHQLREFIAPPPTTVKVPSGLAAGSIGAAGASGVVGQSVISTSTKGSKNLPLRPSSGGMFSSSPTSNHDPHATVTRPLSGSVIRPPSAGKLCIGPQGSVSFSVHSGAAPSPTTEVFADGSVHSDKTPEPRQNTAAMFRTKVLEGSASSYADEILKLKSELVELRDQRQFEKLNAAKLAEEIGSDETFQYIRHLEADREKLHAQLQDLAAQLTTAKIANASLMRKCDKTKQ